MNLIVTKVNFVTYHMKYIVTGRGSGNIEGGQGEEVCRRFQIVCASPLARYRNDSPIWVSKSNKLRHTHTKLIVGALVTWAIYTQRQLLL